MRIDRRARFHVPLVALWLTLSLAGLVLSWVNWRRLADTIEGGVRAAAQNDRLESVFQTLLNAETGERGFLITGKESYLAPLEEAQRVFDGEFAQLARLAVDDPDMIHHVMTLRGLAELRLDEIRRSVELRRDKGFEAAAALMNTDASKATMDDIRRLVGRMRRVRPNLLSLEGEEPRDQLRRASYTSFAAALMGVGAGLFAFRLAMLALAHEKRERELAEAKLRAEQSSEQKTTFLANMSHEIRTPMNSILGFSELLAGDIRDPRQRQYLDSLRASAKSLLQLINDVLDMSKIEAGVMQLRPEPTDPREICEFVETVFLEQATRKGLELRCSVAEDLPRGLLLDRTRIRQILVNLVGNAVKFTEAGHVRVAVDWDRSQGRGSRIELVIQVSDTGCGVPREQLAAIFEPFVQSDPRRGQEREGTGLGLAIVKRLTEVMGGTILVSSEVDRGTRFELRIPDVVVSAKLPISEQSSPEATLDFNEMRPSRVLVADDNKANRDLLAGIFDGSHHQIFFAEDGEQAVTIAQEEKPDLILMDVRMPKLDGYGALEALRSTPGLERTPVIAVTASGLASDEKVIRRAFSGYLRKPFTRRALYNELAQFLPRRETSREAQEARSANGRPENGEPTPARWAELAARLREAEAKEWPAVKDGLSVTEVRQFAERLGVMGRQAGYPPLVAYAEDLLGHCESYAVPEMEQALEAFPGAIRDLERSAS